MKSLFFINFVLNIKLLVMKNVLFLLFLLFFTLSFICCEKNGEFCTTCTENDGRKSEFCGTEEKCKIFADSVILNPPSGEHWICSTVEQ